MNVTKLRVGFLPGLIVVVGIGICAGYISAGADSPALNQVISDYGILIADVDKAAKELEQKKGTAKQDELLQLKESNRVLLEQLERLREQQKEAQKIRDDLAVFSAGDNKNSPPRPEQRRKP